MNINAVTQSHSTTFGGIKPTVISGKLTSAKIFATDVAYSVYDRVKELCAHPALKDAPIRIMPDVHPSSATLVGLSVKANPEKAIPGIVSGDIGCGMLCVSLKPQPKVNYEELDKILRTFVSKKHSQTPSAKSKHYGKIASAITDLGKKYKISTAQMTDELGTVGGGNHFVEIDKDKLGNLFLVIHSGSRNMGTEVYKYYSKIAEAQNPYRQKSLSFLNADESREYLKDMQEALRYAALNRRIIADEILSRMGWKEKAAFESVHNYIAKNGMIRKGAISAEAGEQVIIPLNMRDGAIIGTGKGNKDWNFTAPHGAGRDFSRAEASELITLDEYKNSMKGIFSNSISASTVDESPLAYKSADKIIDGIEDTVKIEEVIKPTFNYKD